MQAKPIELEQDIVVSSESEELILVDSTDSPVGFASKAGCHDGDGVLHRAFSVFLFNEAGELLLQQRSRTKRLWPGYWANSCCSHPRRGELMDEATVRRMQEELGVASDLSFLFKFEYQARFGDLGSENELCWVYLGRCEEQVRPNRTEIDALRFVPAAELDRELAESPDKFTPWLHLEWQRIRSHHLDQIDHLWR